MRTAGRNDALMPIANTKFMNDDEIHAVFAFLKTVPLQESGARYRDAHNSYCAGSGSATLVRSTPS